MKTKWIDFKALREKLTFEGILRHYNIEVRRKGNQHHGFCPLPNHNGKRNSPSFSANLEKGIFQCFGCGAKGNVLDFAALMEKSDPKDGAALRKIAVSLQQRFGSDAEKKPNESKRLPKEDARQSPQKGSPRILNVPLDFDLKGLDAEHPYLRGRGFTPETIGRFGLGFCARGMLKDRVAIPLHDQKGRLVGYAGRVVDDALVTADNPRYRFPGDRVRDGKIFEFRKTRFLYNGFRIQSPVDDLIVVEGFTATWWLVQNDMQNTVSTMGADCSERQAEIIVSLVKPSGTVWIMPDGNAAGERHAITLLRQIAPHRLMRWMKIADGKQPTDLSAEELEALLAKMNTAAS